MMKKTIVTLSLVFVTLMSVVNHAQGLARGESDLSKQELIQEESIAAETDPQVDSEGLAAYYVWYAPNAREGVKAEVASMGGRITFEFDPTLVPALSILLPPAKAVELNTLDSAIFMEPVPERRLLDQASPFLQTIIQKGQNWIEANPQIVPWNVDQVQARDVWDVDRDGIVDPGAPDGSGVKFCIIDTGFFAAHSDHQGVTASGVSQITGENWDEDGHGHGTHVAGTANAQNNDRGVVGVMPGGAELFIVKIFDNTGGWVTGESDLGAAAQICRDNGANALSMSLGGGYSATEERIFQDLYDDNNIVNIAAAGNDGNTVLSYPASYDSVISVAALTEEARWATFSQYPPTAYNPNSPPANAHWDVVELAAGGQGVLSTLPFPDGDVPVYQLTDTGSGVVYSGAHIDESGTGNPIGTMVDGGLCDSVGAWTGQIVLCGRGTVSFAAKVNNVRDGGGVGTVIYNNEPGNFAGTCGGACTTPLIPAISLSQEDGQYLVNNRIEQEGHLLVDDGTGCTDCVGGYDYWDGTSMATPAVAAGVAWVWDSCGGPTGITNKELRQLLRDSAMDLTLDGGVGWDAKTGWGLIQLRDALDLGHQRFGSTCPLTLLVQPPARDICTLSTNSTIFDVILNDTFIGTTNMTVSGYPVGATPVFSLNPVASPDNTTDLTLSGLDNAASGSYVLNIQGTNSDDPDDYATGNPTLNLSTALPANPTLLGPADGAGGEAALPTFSWQPAAQAQGYTLQIATDPGFTNVVRSATGLTGTSYTPTRALDRGIIYYWRVRGSNTCGSGDYSATRAFRTSSVICQSYSGKVGNIKNNKLTTFDLIVPTGDVGSITDVDVVSLVGTHSSVGNLDFRLDSPAGSQVVLIPQMCVGTADFKKSLDDESGSALACPLSDGATQRPSGTLFSFYGQSSTGTWVLRINNSSKSINGNLTGWSLRICRGSIPTAADYSDLAGSYGVAWHTGDGGIRLGEAWSADDGGFAPGNDESDDGVDFPNGFVSNSVNTVVVGLRGTPTYGYWLRLWFDWNGNGVFEDTTGEDGELVLDSNEELVEGYNNITVNVPDGLPAMVNYRARLYDSAGAPTGVLAQDAGSFGGADGGEVEDGTREAPTAVTLTRFEALPAGPSIRLEWETATELDNLGFYLYRGTAADGPYDRLNEQLIPSQAPGSLVGAAYAWTDARVTPGQVYYYRLEAVDVHGLALPYGRVSAAAAHLAYLPVTRK